MRHLTSPRCPAVRAVIDNGAAIGAWWLAIAALVLAWATVTWADDDSSAVASAEAVRHFENKIRPVLIEHCIECHSAEVEVPDGGLVLDRAAGWRMGGDSGPAVVPGDSDGSLLMSAIRYESLEMPPDGQLPEEVIADFQHWIDAGAVDPRGDEMPAERSWAPDGQIDWDEARRFWAFQPPRHRQPPAVEDNRWGRDAVDAHVLARLEGEGLRPSDDAPPLVRLRRLVYDLTGLPPSPELIEAFRADPSEDHWRRIVDHLLHSPQYAEHWGRHWLDVARYADSNGSDFNATFHDAWRYRDFVIQSFAQDKPFDTFVAQQIAGDLLPADDLDEAADNLVATGFLMLGTKMLSERDKAKLEMDVVDDMIDTVGRALLGLTLGCARCHDHKFDPVPTEDYYALAGIFRSTQVLDGESQKYVSTWHKRPLPVPPQQQTAVQRYEQQRKELTSELDAAKKRLEREQQDAASIAAGLVFDDTQADQQGPWQESTYTQPYFGDGYVHDNNRNKGNCQITFPGPASAGTYEVRIAYTAGGNRASNVPVSLHTGGENDKASRHDIVVNQRQKPEHAPYWHSLGEFQFDDVDNARLVIRNDGTDGYVLADAVQYLKPGDEAAEPNEDAEAEQARQRRIAQADAAVKRLEEELAELDSNRPPPIPMAMAVRDAQRVGDTFVCVRGEVDNRGPEVPRGFLRICSTGPAPEIPQDQSGRLELARWLTDPDNPLTARVIVNRVWMHLFGEGLVRTVDNFGVQGQPPSHPELLDALAVEFVRDGWSIRRLIRRLVLTRAYSQSSGYDEAAYQLDPENRLLWRANRKRLPAEAMRDTLLVAAGVLDPTASHAPMAGFGTLVTQNVATPKEVKVQQTPRRSIYLPIIRGKVPSLLATFDFADPDLIVGRRPSTNVPAQGLTLLNNPDVIRWCNRIAERLDDRYDDAPAKVRAAYHRLLQRDASDQELQWMLDYLSAEGDAPDRLAKAVQTLAASTEYRYLD